MSPPNGYIPVEGMLGCTLFDGEAPQQQGGLTLEAMAEAQQSATPAFNFGEILPPAPKRLKYTVEVGGLRRKWFERELQRAVHLGCDIQWAENRSWIDSVFYITSDRQTHDALEDMMRRANA